MLRIALQHARAPARAARSAPSPPSRSRSCSSSPAASCSSPACAPRSRSSGSRGRRRRAGRPDVKPAERRGERPVSSASAGAASDRAGATAAPRLPGRRGTSSPTAPSTRRLVDRRGRLLDGADDAAVGRPRLGERRAHAVRAAQRPRTAASAEVVVDASSPRRGSLQLGDRVRDRRPRRAADASRSSGIATASAAASVARAAGLLPRRRRRPPRRARGDRADLIGVLTRPAPTPRTSPRASAPRSTGRACAC